MSEQLVVVASRPVRALRMMAAHTLLHRTGEYIEKGAEVVLGEPELWVHEDIQKITLPSVMQGSKFWVLVEELALGEEQLAWVKQARSKQLAQESRDMSTSETQFFLVLCRQAKRATKH